MRFLAKEQQSATFAAAMMVYYITTSPPSCALPHWLVIRSTAGQIVEALSRTSIQAMAGPNSLRQSSPTRRCVTRCCQMRSFGSDGIVLVDYTMTMTTNDGFGCYHDCYQQRWSWMTVHQRDGAAANDPQSTVRSFCWKLAEKNASLAHQKTISEENLQWRTLMNLPLEERAVVCWLAEIYVV